MVMEKQSPNWVKRIKAKDPDFYHRIGAMGGRKSRGGGFAKDRQLAKTAGRLGGLKSRPRYE